MFFNINSGFFFKGQNLYFCPPAHLHVGVYVTLPERHVQVEYILFPGVEKNGYYIHTLFKWKWRAKYTRQQVL